MDSKELRQKFISFFEDKGHKRIASSNLSPTDNSVLFTTAGMQQLVPYLMGSKHSEGDKLVNIQKCLRTDDIEEVGDETHLTFFEMMGNWSLGDYWKKEAIDYSYEFFVNELGINPKNMAITCFEGDAKNDITKDTESAEVWNNLGIPEERIAFLGYDDNFWGPIITEGPCGPDTEIFVWNEESEAPKDFDPKNPKWVEIGNDVFMQYRKTADGKFEPLVQKNVDFGSGFERVVTYLQKKPDIYQTDLFASIIKKIEDLNGLDYVYGDKSDKEYIEKGDECWVEERKRFRIIADHIRAATFAINEDILPSNKEQGYIIRRLIRRAIVKGAQLKIDQNFTHLIAEEVMKNFDGVYEFNQDLVINELKKEEEKFRKTLSAGIKLLANQTEITGKVLFDLYQTYGLPLEISQEESKNNGLKVNGEAIKQFNALLKQHQDLSRTASAGMFKGGLAGGGEMETKLHTATHLLLASLRQILGSEVMQKGANITPERLRFDFNYLEKLTAEQIEKIENLVNEKIAEKIPVDMEEMSLEDAKNCGALGAFGEKYGFKVKVYTMGTFSKEICGGPHVKNTSELGHFKITKEESSSAGVRRIKAILE